MSEDYNKAFRRARLRAMDDLRRNKQLSIAIRLVGLEILWAANKVSGFAFAREETIANKLGITTRTVRTAVKALKAAGVTKVMRRGRHNVYFPAFVERIEENISGIAGGPAQSCASVRAHASPENFGADTGKKQHGTPEKNNPLTLEGKPGRTPSTKEAAEKNRTRRDKLKARQEAENEIANAIGWPCVQEIPPEQFEDLCRRWQDGGLDMAELFELKQKYGPTAAAAGRR
jgi:Helix-turn-helix domain